MTLVEYKGKIYGGMKEIAEEAFVAERPSIASLRRDMERAAGPLPSMAIRWSSRLEKSNSGSMGQPDMIHQAGTESSC
jgi:hypothetical protein